MNETALEQADHNFEVIDGHREQWEMLEPHDPIEQSYAGDIEFGRAWLADWRSRLPEEWRLPDD